MPIHTKVSGTWHELAAVHVRVSGAWQACKQVWVRVSGVWQKVHAGILATLSATITNGSDGSRWGYWSGVAGSISADTYTDGAGHSRQILEIGWSPAPLWGTLLQIAGSVPNNDQSFYDISIDGNTPLLRSNADFNDLGTYSQWQWAPADFGFPATSSLVVRCKY
jgi:hypothetical protein